LSRGGSRICFDSKLLSQAIALKQGKILSIPRRESQESSKACQACLAASLATTTISNKQTTSMAPKPPTLWEIAKEILVQEIGSGKIPHTMGPMDVHGLRLEYRAVDYTKFRTNLNNLRKALIALKGKATVDSEAFAYDQRMHPPAAANPPDFNYPSWDRSDAKRLLKIDVSEGRHNQLTPRQLWGTQLEYKVYPLDVFRKHIHQEVRNRRESSYWLNRQRKKKKKTAADYVIVDHERML
jgi:hypothetical protein